MRPLLRYILIALLGVRCIAAVSPAYAKLEEIDLLSDRNLLDAKAKLDQLRPELARDKLDGALAMADAIECLLLGQTEPNKVVAFADHALIRVAGTPNIEAAVRLVMCRGFGHEQTGDLSTAHIDYQTAIDRARAGKLPLVQAWAMGYLADLVSYQGDLATGLTLARGAVALIDRQNLAASQAQKMRLRRELLGRMANIYTRMDEPQKAATYYKDILAEDEALGNTQSVISGYYNLGRSYQESGDLPQALAMQRKGLELGLKIKDDSSTAWLQRAMGSTLVEQEKYAEAMPLLNSALRAFTGYKDEEMIGQIQYLQGKAKVGLGDRPTAERLLASAIATFRKNTNLRYLDLALQVQAGVLAKSGKYEQAYQLLVERNQVRFKLEKELQSKTSARLRVEFDTQQMEEQNKDLLAQHKRQAEKLQDSRQIERLQLLAIGLGGILFALLSLFAFKQIRATRRLSTIAMTDELTTLANRRSIYAWAEQQWRMTRDSNEAFCLILIDIDFFKRINDEFGHPMGDKVLREVAICCRDQLRKMDRIGRVGGEEFMVVLPYATPQAAADVAERLRSAIDAMPATDWAEGLHVTISLGVAIRKSPDETLPAMVQRADVALYQAKQGGRNRAEIVD